MGGGRVGKGGGRVGKGGAHGGGSSPCGVPFLILFAYVQQTNGGQSPMVKLDTNPGVPSLGWGTVRSKIAW